MKPAHLFAGVRLGDGVAELVLVLGDALVDQVVLPEAVEYALEVDAGTIEGQLLELDGVDPAWKMLVAL
jgi:hypothetical protein